MSLPVRSTPPRSWPYQKVLDLRTGQESGSIQEVMDGDLDPFIEAKLRGKVRVKGAKDEED